jgi:Xaa-Pro aminopeptidase
MTTATSLYQQRLNDVRAHMQQQEIAAILITNPTNRQYISGFSGTAGSLLVTPTTALLFTDFRYHTQAPRQAPAFTLHTISHEKPLSKQLPALVAELGLTTLCFEAEHWTVAYHETMQDSFATYTQEHHHHTALLPTKGVVEAMRERKYADELAIIRQAVAITDETLAAVVPHLQPDHTERQVAWLLERTMRERGADGVAFPIIVAAGTNAAMPHAQPGDSPLGSGQPVIIDMGATYRHYHADLTRTIVLGAADERFWNVYQTVLAAQEHALATIRPGLSGHDADMLARTSITDAGQGEYFGHGLGHGVGLDIHEGPRLGSQSEHTLQAGSVFSVEPGIYLPEWGGVRIEDLVVLHEDGCEVLSQASKEPVQPR